MSAPSQEPSELLYTPSESWAPAVVAVGLAVALVAVFGAWWWAPIGILIALAGMRAWWTTADDEVARMRREQATDTAVVPAKTLLVDTRDS